MLNTALGAVAGAAGSVDPAANTVPLLRCPIWVFARLVRVDGVQYLLLGRFAPRYRGTERREVSRALRRCRADRARVRQSRDGRRGARVGPDAPSGRSPFGEVDGVVFVGDAREPFASIARDAEFDPLAGADIAVLSGAPWPAAPTPQAPEQRAGRAEAVARGELAVTYDRSCTKQIHGPAHTH